MTNDGFCNILHCHTQYFYLLQFFSLWCGLIVAFALEFSLFCFLPMNVVSSQVKWSFSSCWESLHYILSSASQSIAASFCNAQFWPGFWWWNICCCCKLLWVSSSLWHELKASNLCFYIAKILRYGYVVLESWMFVSQVHSCWVLVWISLLGILLRLQAIQQCSNGFPSHMVSPIFRRNDFTLHCNLYAEMEDLSEFKFHLCSSVC